MEYVEGGPIVVGKSATEKSQLPELVARRFFRDIILVRLAQAAMQHASIKSFAAPSQSHVALKQPCNMPR